MFKLYKYLNKGDLKPALFLELINSEREIHMYSIHL